MEDKTIISLLKEHPDNGIKEAINKYRGFAYAIISRVVINESDCEECLSDVFVSVWKSRGNLNENGSLKGYIAVTARNSAINCLKETQTITHLPLYEEIAENDTENIDYLFDLREDLRALEKEIRKLKPPNDEIFVRRHYLFQSIKEISKILHLSEKQVKNSLYYSKKRTKKLIMKGRLNYEK